MSHVPLQLAKFGAAFHRFCCKEMSPTFVRLYVDADFLACLEPHLALGGNLPASAGAWVDEEGIRCTQPPFRRSASLKPLGHYWRRFKVSVLARLSPAERQPLVSPIITGNVQVARSESVGVGGETADGIASTLAGLLSTLQEKKSGFNRTPDLGTLKGALNPLSS